ncbi:hypothetical protein [Roseimarinus sediminis]|uniref:hypothetical protein n=1 Tax=Roseimarinus sediminis TaxID=1610899 RepID=UPI003D1DCE82
MVNLNDAGKRDFINQIKKILEENAEPISQAGFDPLPKIEALSSKAAAVEAAEVKQQQAQAAAKDATKLARNTLSEAYKEASETVSLLEGLLGKDHNLIKEIKKMRT